MTNDNQAELQKISLLIQKRVKAMVMQLEELKNHLTPAQVEGMDEAELTVRLEYIDV